MIETTLAAPIEDSTRRVWKSPLPENAGRAGARKTMDARTIFLLGLMLAASGLVSPAVALVSGVAYGMTMEHPYRREASSLSKLLLQISVVLLGFGINLQRVLHAGASGFLYTAMSIAVAVALGLLLGRLLRIGTRTSYLITMGTAICGGSAIAALAPITCADEDDISVSMGTVFLLNSVALLLFPLLGWKMHLSQSQFGLWAALAIHDTSSVVGATAKYGDQALAIGTTVKLARALWIVPASVLTALLRNRVSAPAQGTGRAGVKIPWFIFLFLLASVASTYVRHGAAEFHTLDHAGRLGLTGTLFLIGTGLSRETLGKVGFRPLLQGVALWILMGSASLAAIYFRVISI